MDKRFVKVRDPPATGGLLKRVSSKDTVVFPCGLKLISILFGLHLRPYG